jgi:hypothetical protein
MTGCPMEHPILTRHIHGRCISFLNLGHRDVSSESVLLGRVEAEAIILAHFEDSLSDGYRALLQLPMAGDPSQAVSHAAVADSLFPEFEFASLAVAFVGRRADLIERFLSDVNWGLFRAICEGDLSDNAFAYFSAFFQIRQVHRASFENGLFGAIGENHSTLWDDDATQVERNIVLLARIVSSATEMPSQAIDVLMRRAVMLFDAGVDIPSSAQPFFVRFLYHVFLLSNSDRIRDFISSRSDLFDMVLSWNCGKNREICFLIGLLLCQVCAAAGFSEIGFQLTRRRIHYYIVRYLFSEWFEVSSVYLYALTLFIEVFSTKIGDLATSGALTRITELLTDGEFQLKASAGLFFAVVCRHACDPGLIDWIVERGIVSELIRLVSVWGDEPTQAFILDAVLRIMRDEKLTPLDEDIEFMTDVRPEIATVPFQG